MSLLQEDFIPALALFLPMLAANQGPGLARMLDLKFAKTPVSRRWLGENKTIAAYYMGPVLAMSVLLVYTVFFPNPDWANAGLTPGLGTVLGDHMKSFFKRRLGRPPGSPWFLDRIDFAIGGGLAAKWYYDWVTWKHVLCIILLAWPIHYFGNRFSHSRGWRDTPH